MDENPGVKRGIMVLILFDMSMGIIGNIIEIILGVV